MQSTHHSTEPPAPTPEVKKGEFVGIINDLARAWRLRRSIAAMNYLRARDDEDGVTEECDDAALETRPDATPH